jgi:hypothetical protein
VTTDDLRRTRCWPQRNEAYRMAEGGRFGTIVIGGAWNWYFLSGDYTYDAGGTRIPLTTPEGKHAALERLGRRVRTLIQSGKRVIFLLDNPSSSSFNPKGWTIRISLSATGKFKSNSTVEIDPKQFELRQELTNWAKSMGASVIDPFDAVCNGDVCYFTTATGQPMFKDEGHFNPDWTIGHAAFIDAAVTR